MVNNDAHGTILRWRGPGAFSSFVGQHGKATQSLGGAHSLHEYSQSFKLLIGALAFAWYQVSPSAFTPSIVNHCEPEGVPA